MDRRKLCAICLVKNEDDIIAQTLIYATRYCDRIFVLDNGSTDDTWDTVQALAKHNSAIVPFRQIKAPFEDGLRAMVYNAVHDQLSEDDWWLILDGDEFLAEDPRPVIETAVRQGADVIKAWMIQFFFTERDLEIWEQRKDRRDIPIFDRRRYYMINWQETRLFRNQTHSPWNVRVKEYAPDFLKCVCSRRILIRHYQYRDPEQIEKRLRIRYGRFQHVRDLDWRSVIADSRSLSLHRDGDPWRFRVSGVLHYYRQAAVGKYQRALRRLRALAMQETE